MQLSGLSDKWQTPLQLKSETISTPYSFSKWITPLQKEQIAVIRFTPDATSSKNNEVLVAKQTPEITSRFDLLHMVNIELLNGQRIMLNPLHIKDIELHTIVWAEYETGEEAYTSKEIVQYYADNVDISKVYLENAAHN